MARESLSDYRKLILLRTGQPREGAHLLEEKKVAREGAMWCWLGVGSEVLRLRLIRERSVRVDVLNWRSDRE